MNPSLEASHFLTWNIEWISFFLVPGVIYGEVSSEEPGEETLVSFPSAAH